MIQSELARRRRRLALPRTAYRAENATSLFEELRRGSGFTNHHDGVDKYSTDRKRSHDTIARLRPVYFGMTTQIFSGRIDKERYSTVIGTADKPALAASLSATDSLVKAQNFGDGCGGSARAHDAARAPDTARLSRVKNKPARKPRQYTKKNQKKKRNPTRLSTSAFVLVFRVRELAD